MNFLYFLAIFFLILGTIAVVFTFKYEDEEEASVKIQEKEFEGKGISTLSLLWEGFRTFKNFILSLFCFCGPCNSLFIFIFL